MADVGKDGRRALKIKCGAVSRLRKEIGTYEKESATEAAKLEAMRAANACPHDIKQQACARALQRRQSHEARVARRNTRFALVPMRACAACRAACADAAATFGCACAGERAG